MALSGLLNVRQGDETRQFDLRPSDGQVVLPMAQGPYGIDITLAEADDVSPMDRLS